MAAFERQICPQPLAGLPDGVRVFGFRKAADPPFAACSVGATFLTGDTTYGEKALQRRAVAPVGQQAGLVEPASGLGGADFPAGSAFEALLEMQIDGVEIGHGASILSTMAAMDCPTGLGVVNDLPVFGASGPRLL
ncbi:MAG: hypothetical protein OXF89_07095 [Rhodospirillaceae bacterium]|nr:hypothetical protein [Rhodospirillaceae bacterium]